MPKQLENEMRERRAETLEALAELYLRLNGYFCIPNYLYHRDLGAFGLRTESDVLAVRMTHQREVLADGREQLNDSRLVLPESDGWIDCVIAEVKEPAVKFNQPLRDAGGVGLIEDALRMFGVLPDTAFKKNDAAGCRMARELHAQIVAAKWPQYPRADSPARGAEERITRAGGAGHGHRAAGWLAGLTAPEGVVRRRALAGRSVARRPPTPRRDHGRVRI